jgi:hypothetical protein
LEANLFLAPGEGEEQSPAEKAAQPAGAGASTALSDAVRILRG